MRRLRSEISINDSVEHFKKLGVEVFLGHAQFISPDTVEVDGKKLNFKRAVIATGSRAAVPNIPGLKEAGFLTNETIFQLALLPKRLLILGAGPIGSEMAQAFQRLGSQVTVVHRDGHILHREDADAAEIVQKKFLSEGIHLIFNANTTEVRERNGVKVLTIEQSGIKSEIECDAILVSAGRTPVTEGLRLEAAGVQYTAKGVTVNDWLRTTNPRIYAAGDLITYFTTAMALGKGLSSLAKPIYPYPTQGEILKKLANLNLQEKLSPFIKLILKTYLKWRRR